MPLLDLNSIEGYAAAVARQDAVRDIAFLGVPEVLCGIEVSPLTFRHLLWLEQLQSPFTTSRGEPPEASIARREVRATDENEAICVAAFFKTVICDGTDFKPAFLKRGGALRRLDELMRPVGRLKLPDAVTGICEFLDETFMDAPGGRGDRSESYYSIGAAITHRVAEAYPGLNPNPFCYPAAMDMPLKAAFQLLKCLKKSEDPKAILFNGLSDRVKTIWMNRQVADAHIDDAGRNLSKN